MHASYVDIFCPRWVGNRPMTQAFSIVRGTLISAKNRSIGCDRFIYFQRWSKLWPWIDIIVQLSSIKIRSFGFRKTKVAVTAKQFKTFGVIYKFRQIYLKRLKDHLNLENLCENYESIRALFLLDLLHRTKLNLFLLLFLLIGNQKESKENFR